MNIIFAGAEQRDAESEDGNGGVETESGDVQNSRAHAGTDRQSGEKSSGIMR